MQQSPVRSARECRAVAASGQVARRGTFVSTNSRSGRSSNISTSKVAPTPIASPDSLPARHGRPCHRCRLPCYSANRQRCAKRTHWVLLA
eukprot:285940-Pleurochrysis_carterae.AAC.2